MDIIKIDTGRVHIPLKKPFVTAVRTAHAIDLVRVEIKTKDGLTGYGEAPASALVTGETLASIEEAIRGYIAPALIAGNCIQTSIYGNNSAKAAVDMALYDLRAKKMGIPLYQLLGGGKKVLTNDITISLGDPFKKETCEGFGILKIKVGPETTAQKIIELWQSIRDGNTILRIDANQSWNPITAIKIIQELEDAGICIDLIEQPVPAWDLDGMAFVQARTLLPIAADESVSTPQDALLCIEKRAARVINIKLMKTGSITRALDICALCRVHGLECMMGCMLEGQISAAAAAHLAASQAVITRVDIDSPLLAVPGFYSGGPEFLGPLIKMTDCPGIGVKGVKV